MIFSRQLLVLKSDVISPTSYSYVWMIYFLPSASASQTSSLSSHTWLSKLPPLAKSKRKKTILRALMFGSKRIKVSAFIWHASLLGQSLMGSGTTFTFILGFPLREDMKIYILVDALFLQRIQCQQHQTSKTNIKSHIPLDVDTYFKAH